MKRKDKHFTGRDALLWIVLFFGAIVTVNGIMIWFALTSGSVDGRAKRVTLIERSVAVAAVKEEARYWPI